MFLTKQVHFHYICFSDLCFCISAFSLLIYHLYTEVSEALGDALKCKVEGPESLYGEKNALQEEAPSIFQENGNALGSLASELHTLIDPGF